MFTEKERLAISGICPIKRDLSKEDIQKIRDRYRHHRPIYLKRARTKCLDLFDTGDIIRAIYLYEVPLPKELSEQIIFSILDRHRSLNPTIAEEILEDITTNRHSYENITKKIDKSVKQKLYLCEIYEQQLNRFKLAKTNIDKLIMRDIMRTPNYAKTLQKVKGLSKKDICELRTLYSDQELEVRSAVLYIKRKAGLKRFHRILNSVAEGKELKNRKDQLILEFLTNKNILLEGKLTDFGKRVRLMFPSY